MPKVIANYARNDQENDEQEGKGRLCSVPILILIVLLAFAIKAGADSWKRIGFTDSGLAEKAKVCMGEFTELRCNTFDLNGECKKIYDCVQAGKTDPSAQIYNFFEGLSEEILVDYPFPAAIVGLLLMLQLRDVVKGRNPRQ